MWSLHPPTSDGVTAPEALVQQFEKSEHDIRVANYGRTAVWAIIFMLAGVTLDFMVFPEKVGDFFIIRCLCSLCLGAVRYFMRRPRSLLVTRITVHIIGILPMLSILMMIPSTGGVASPYYAGINLVLVAASLLLRWPTRDGIINACLCLGGYIVAITPSILSSPALELSVAYNNIYFIFVTAFFTCAGTYYYNALRFQEFSLRSQLEASRADLEENNRKLQALDEAKMRFFANVSHELRTPLTLILGPLESLKRDPAITREPRNVELLAMLEDNGLRLLRLINELLDLVRLDGGVMTRRRERIDLRKFVNGLVANLRATAETKQIRFTGVCEIVGTDECLMDQDRLEKILLNLAINAIKFTSLGGRIELSAKLTSEHLQFIIADTGTGIRPEELPYVFERFWQADMSAKRKHGGVGIGLALVKSIVDSLEGTIIVTSEVGVGTTFSVTLPLVTTESQEDEDVTASQEQPLDPVEKLYQRARLSGLTDQDDHQTMAFAVDFPVMPNASTGSQHPLILVADDEPGLRRYLAQTLSPHHVLQAKDGLEAWELARQYIPELIILDLMMPGLDGIEVTKRLREHTPTAHTPIVLVTANAEDSLRIEALEAGVSDFLTKPFSTTELTTRVRNLLIQRRHERDLASSKKALEVAHEELKDNEVRLVQAESLSALGTMSAGIIHEVNNPLNYTHTALHTLRTFERSIPAADQADFNDILGDAIEGVGRVIQIISDLRSFTTGTAGHAEQVDLAKTLEAARRLVSKDLARVTLTVDIPPATIVMGNANQLSQVFQNLLQNAASFVPAAKQRGDIPTIIVQAEKSATSSVILTVRDNGCGIASADIGKIFSPFFTKRDVGQGMGLGLSICHQILSAHRAEVHVSSEVNAFTQFTVCFPPLDMHFEFDVSHRPSSLGTSSPAPIIYEP